MNILVTLTSSTNQTGPFFIYTNLNNYEAPAYGPYTKSQLTSGTIVNVPDATKSIRIRSNGECVNSIFLQLPTT